MSNPYEAPAADVEIRDEIEYVGFWSRVLASIVDSILMLIIIWPILWAVYGDSYFTETRMVGGAADVLLNYVFPAIAVIAFWMWRSATPGKMLMKAKIVDARTGGKPSTGQLIGRYFGYFASMIPLFLGMFWIGFDARKQGWHDKLAGTVVVRYR